mgnify:CR=1 FL=1
MGLGLLWFGFVGGLGLVLVGSVKLKFRIMLDDDQGRNSGERERERRGLLC